MFSHAFEHLVAIHNRHISIKKDYIRILIFRDSEPLGSIACRNNLIVAPFKTALDDAETVGFVIDDKYPSWGDFFIRLKRSEHSYIPSIIPPCLSNWILF